MSYVPEPMRIAARSVKRRSTLAVFIALYDSLSDEEFRKPPVYVVAVQLGLHESNVYRAIDELTALGLLERGDRLGNALTFKLMSQRRAAA